MPIPILFADTEQDLEPSESTEISVVENTVSGSSRLLRTHRQELEAEIEHAKDILEYPDIDAQEEIYSEETLDCAIAFLKIHVDGLWRSYGLQAPIPAIGPGPARSVDLYWEEPSWKLLVNVPAEKDALVTFYADGQGRQKAKGSVDPNQFSVSIAACLMA